MYSEPMKIYASDNISKKSLKVINEIMVNSNISTEDKKLLFSIFTYSLKYHGINNEGMLKSFAEFVLNDKVRNKKFFSRLLKDINNEFIKISIIYKDDTYGDLIIQLNRKIKTISEIGIKCLKMEDENYFNLLCEILNSDVYFLNYDYIIDLFEKEPLIKNPSKLSIVLDIALKQKIDITDFNCNLRPYFWNVLTNEDVLLLNNEEYRKVVEISIKGIQSYIVDKAISQENITLNKKNSLIDYYEKIFNKNLSNYFAIDVASIERKEVSREIFNVVYCDRLCMMSDEEYDKVLNVIKNSNNPDSCAKVMVASNINEEQRRIALKLINSGHNMKKDKSVPWDHKNAVANAAISPVLAKCSLDQYAKILQLINSYCDKIEQSYDYRDIANNIAAILCNEKTFLNNEKKLKMSIKSLATNNIYLSRICREFCENPISSYYTDKEYKKILELLQQEEAEHVRQLLSVFTNKNVPFIEDKNELFEIVTQGPENLTNYIYEMDKLGNFNSNLAEMFDGIDQAFAKQILDVFNNKENKISSKKI